MNSRCGLRNVHEVIASFDDCKRLIVKSIGFGGLLKFPMLSQMNRKLALWLMTKVDECSQSIVVDSCRCFPFTKEDVHLVFGIPACGKRVVLSDGCRSDTRVEFVRTCLGLQGKDARCIKAAQDILVRSYNSPMHPAEEDAFRVAFVIFVMAMLLAPSSKHDYSNTEFWHALAKPNDIGSYDWSSYVIYRLLVASAKLKSDINKKIRTPLLSGCTFFLQVFYLDSIDLGALNMLHNILPRAQCFTSDRIKAMAAVDACRNEHGERIDSLSLGPLWVGNDVCYTWARSRGSTNQTSGRTRRLFDAATQLVSSLNISEEAATPSLLAMMQHRRQLVDMVDEEQVTLLEVIGMIANSYKNGFNYCSPVRGMRRAIDAGEATPFLRPSSRAKHMSFSPVVHLRHHDGTDIIGNDAGSSNKLLKQSSMFQRTIPMSGTRALNGLPLGSQVSLNAHLIHELQLDETPRELTLPLTQLQSNDVHTHSQNLLLARPNRDSSPSTVNKVMSEYYLWSRKCKSLATVHSCASKDDFEETLEPVVKIRARCHSSPPTPWELGQHEVVNVDKAIEFYSWLTTLHPRPAITAPWLLHFRPKFIELALYDIHEQITARSDFDTNFMDICIRRIKQMDDVLYTSHTECRWQHFMEADFMAAMLAGRRLTHSPPVRHQLTGTHLSYDVPSCRCIFFPAIVNQRWVCYVWDLAENEVIVYDPLTNDEVGKKSICAHSDVVQKLGVAMDQCANFFFDGWDQSWINPNFRFHSPITDGPPRNRSGVYVAHFCRYFNGSQVIPELSRDLVKQTAASLLFDALLLTGNEGKLPQKFREISNN